MKKTVVPTAGGDEQNFIIELLTIKDVAELLKVSQSSIRRLQQGRHLPFFKVGGSVRFAKTDIFEYLKKGRVEAIS
ncbi:MAG: helix-turn-helix domain-containing protein [bacterium]|nr:helix-turn-helix domain-containing protein [bacterium]